MSKKIKKIFAGYERTAIIDIENNLWIFGENSEYQLGLGDDLNRNVPTLLVTPNKVKSIAFGDNHTLLIDIDDNVWSCGYNAYGQLGLGDDLIRKRFEQIPNIKALQVSAGNKYSLILDIDNNVWIFGNNINEPVYLRTEINKNIKAVKVIAEKDSIVLITII